MCDKFLMPMLFFKVLNGSNGPTETTGISQVSGQLIYHVCVATRQDFICKRIPLLLSCRNRIKRLTKTRAAGTEERQISECLLIVYGYKQKA